MRRHPSIVLSALAMAITAANADTTCAKGLYILCARGSGEAATGLSSGPYAHPNNTGSPGIIAAEVQKQIEGSVISGVDYPATEPTDITNLTSYYSSEGKGAKGVWDDVSQYHSACPDSKIALIGYSQGAQAIQDALCGGLGSPFDSQVPLSPELVTKNSKSLSCLLVIAIALVADPTHIANTTYDRGTSVHNGVFPRTNTTVCNQYDNLMGSWCGNNDVYCDSGSNVTEHTMAALTYKDDVVKFVVEKWNDSVKGDSGSTGSGKPNSTTTGAPTGSHTNTGKTSSASGLALSQNWALAGLLLAILSQTN